MLKRLIAVVFLVVFMLPLTFSASASVTDSYTRFDVQAGTENVISRNMYNPTVNITAATLGLEENLEGITDIFCDNGSNVIYLLCGDNSRLISMNSSYKDAKEIKITDKDGIVDFKGARGIYSDGNNIYIADTVNARVIITDLNGGVVSILESPDSQLIPEDFLFQPIAVERDSEGFTYILSLGCYYGALMYSPDYEFMGFYGSNTVQTTALDTLSFLWDKLTSTDTKKASSYKTLPYSFSDFCLDSDGFMVTITGAISSNKYTWGASYGQIKKISHNGDNILFKRRLSGDAVSSTSVNFLEGKRPEGSNVQDLVSVAVSNSNYIYVLDTGNGTVYIYDSDCNLMSAFGGGYNTGEQIGVFKNANAITLNGESLLVADKGRYCVTVFDITEYGSLIMQAQSYYLKGDYLEAKTLWESVLSMNRSCQLAYRGLAMAYYSEGNYDDALDAARIALDYSVYDMAWQEIVSAYIANNFIWILIVLAAVIAGIVWLVVFLRKKQLKLIKSPKLKLALNVPFHPFDSFDDLKYKKLGSLKIALVITALFYIATVLNDVAAGFLYTDTLMRNYNSFYTLGSTVGLVVLWSVCNWLVCSMFNGKGKLNEVYIATCYALVPWIVFKFLRVILTHFLPLSTSGLITGIETALLIFTFFLVTIAMLKVHEYDFFKFLLTGFVTLFLMLLVLFILFLCAILIMQFITFIESIYEEIAYR